MNGKCDSGVGMFSAFRNEEASRDDFIFYSKRLMRILIEHALSLLPFKVSSFVVKHLFCG